MAMPAPGPSDPHDPASNPASNPVRDPASEQAPSGDPPGPQEITALIPEELEQQLKEARDEIAMLEEQLFLVQEELEHYFLLSQARLEAQAPLPSTAFAAQGRHPRAVGRLDGGPNQPGRPPEPDVAASPARQDQDLAINNLRRRLLRPL